MARGKKRSQKSLSSWLYGTGRTLVAARDVAVVTDGRRALLAGLPTVVVLNIGATVVAAVAFHFLMGRFSRAGPADNRVWAVAIQLWLGLIIAVGLYVFANNLFAIVHGRSLFPLV